MDQGAREAMEGQAVTGAIAEQGARATVVDLGTREAMAEQGAWTAVADQGTQGLYGWSHTTPQKNSLWKSRGSIGQSHWRREHLRAHGRCRDLRTLRRRGLWRALSRNWHWSVHRAGVNSGLRPSSTSTPLRTTPTFLAFCKTVERTNQC